MSYEPYPVASVELPIAIAIWTIAMGRSIMHLHCTNESRKNKKEKLIIIGTGKSGKTLADSETHSHYHYHYRTSQLR